MRMTTMAAVVSSLLLGAAVAHAGDTKTISSDQFKAADKDRDGNLSLAEAQSGMPTLAAQFTSVDTNGDGKISADELSSYNKAMEADQATSPPKDK